MAAAASAEAREYWRQINTRIHEEEQQLKELVLDHNERVAVVEGLKVELRQCKRGIQECAGKRDSLLQATIAAVQQLQELKKEYTRLGVDREMLDRLATEQGGIAQETVALADARSLFERQLAEQQAHLQTLRRQVAAGEGPQGVLAEEEEAGAAGEAVDVDGAGQHDELQLDEAGVVQSSQ